MPSRPRVSVIVPSYLGAQEIGDCLTSLADQDLPSDQYEVVLVLNGPEDGTRMTVDTLVRSLPGFRVRIISTTRPGAGRARNLGLQAALGEFTCFVDHDDWVSPTFLSGLLTHARPGEVAMAPIADVHEDEPVPNYENYIGNVVNDHLGETLPPIKRRTALGFNAAKLVPTALARSVRYDESVASGEDLLYWFDLCNKVSFAVRMTAAQDGAVYYRRVRDGSLSRQNGTFEFLVEGRLDMIERLVSRELSPGDGSLDVIRRSLIAGQTTLLRRWLDAHPGERDRVLAAIRSRGLADSMAWHVLNTGGAKELAALVAFTPWLATSGVVAARRVRRRNELVDVLQVDLSDIAARDNSVMRMTQEQVARRAVLKVPTDALKWPAVKAYVRAGMAQVREWQELQGPYESLYTRAMLPASHILGAWLKLKNPDLYWRAEFSDPIVWNGYGQRRVGRAADDRIYRRLANQLKKAGVQPPEDRNIAELVELVAWTWADELWFTNEQQLEFMLARIPDPALAERVRARAVVEVHPTPDPELYDVVESEYAVDPDLVNIGYFGVFYPTRGLTEVVGALQRLSPEERRRVKFHVFTSDPEALAAEALEHGLDDVIVPNAYVPYLEFLALTKVMDVLLVNDFRTLQHYDLNPYLPAKWADYLGSGSDVWAVVEPGSVLSKREMRYRSELADVDGAEKVLRQAIMDHSGS